MSILVNNENLWNILQSDENDKLDFKQAELLMSPDNSNRRKIARHICGFANHRGGLLIFGVDDEGTPEGADLIERECLSTISEITSGRLSPTISFSHEFYSEAKGHLSEGSIFVLDIDKRERAPPVAVTEQSEGKIKKREYRIRSGDSTRLVSDSELTTLFNDNPDIEIEESFPVVHWLSEEDLSPAQISPRPSYFFELNNILSKILDKRPNISERLPSYEGTDNLMREHRLLDERIILLSILCQIFTMDDDGLPEKFYDRFDRKKANFEFEKQSNLSSETIEDDIFQHIPLTATQVISDYQDRVVYPDEREHGVLLPENTDINIAMEENLINITSEDKFNLDISIDPIHVQTGLPKEHPESTKGQYSRPPNKSETTILSARFELQMKVSFDYPQQSYEDYSVCKDYIEIIIEELNQFYDWERFIDKAPDKKLNSIDSKVDRIEEKLEEIDKNI